METTRQAVESGIRAEEKTRIAEEKLKEFSVGVGGGFFLEAFFSSGECSFSLCA